MRAAGKPTQDIFCADDRNQPGQRIAIDRCNEHDTCVGDQTTAIPHKRVNIGDVFDDFHIQNNVESFIGSGECRRSYQAIVDLEILLRGVQRCYMNIFFDNVDASD